MRVILSPLSKKQLKKHPKLIQFLVAKKIRDLASGAEITNIKPLVRFKDIYRIRIGDYRLVYKKFSDKYYVVLIENRKRVYEILKRIW